MTFMVKDLLITVMGEQFGGASDHCTGACCLNPCSLPSCDANSCVVTPITGHFAENVINPGDLALLKEQLVAAVADIEEREAAARKELAPQTLADAQAAERQLRAALAEVESIKKNLGG